MLFVRFRCCIGSKREERKRTSSSICIKNIDESGDELCTGGKRSISSNFWSTKTSPISVGREFVLVSDHKPLVGLLGKYASSANGISENPSMGQILSGYSYTLRYKPGWYIGRADACSRLPLQLPSTTEKEQPETIQFLQQLKSSPVLARDVRRWTEQLCSSWLAQ